MQIELKEKLKQLVSVIIVCISLITVGWFISYDYIVYNAISEFYSDAIEAINDKTNTSTQIAIAFTGEFPEEFDLRDYYGETYVTGVKNQNPYGACWAFSTISAIESNLLMRGYGEFDFSESHLMQFNETLSTNPFDMSFDEGVVVDTPLEKGGNWIDATATLSSWCGLVADTGYSVYPYHENERRNSIAHLQDVFLIEEMDLMDFAYTYKIKTLLQSMGAVQISYYSQDNLYKVSSHTVCYYQEYIKEANHNALIIGWDDNFPATRFKNQPPGDGAWLVQNSWGKSWGDGGYFWMSYYEVSLNNAAVYKVAMPGEPGFYSKIYEHDAHGFYTSYTFGDAQEYEIANMFIADSDEMLKAASIYTLNPDTEFEVRVYISPKDRSPTSGKLVKRVKGHLEYAGYHTIDLDEIPLKANEKFSIVVKAMTPGREIVLPAEGSGANYPNYKIIKTSQANQSYIKTYNIWSDVKDLEQEVVFNNFCIKAFTD